MATARREPSGSVTPSRDTITGAPPIVTRARPGSTAARSAARMLQPRKKPATKRVRGRRKRDRKSTRLNSSHLVISYAVFCLKKKRKDETHVLSSDACLE